MSQATVTGFYHFNDWSKGEALTLTNQSEAQVS
jgi:hypothetical protein